MSIEGPNDNSIPPKPYSSRLAYTNSQSRQEREKNIVRSAAKVLSRALAQPEKQQTQIESLSFNILIAFPRQIQFAIESLTKTLDNFSLKVLLRDKITVNLADDSGNINSTIEFTPNTNGLRVKSTHFQDGRAISLEEAEIDVDKMQEIGFITQITHKSKKEFVFNTSSLVTGNTKAETLFTIDLTPGDAAMN